MLYPLWKIKESSELLHTLASYNLFSQVVELLRFAMYGQFNGYAFVYTLVAFVIFMTVAVWGYNPSKGMEVKNGRTKLSQIGLLGAEEKLVREFFFKRHEKAVFWYKMSLI